MTTHAATSQTAPMSVSTAASVAEDFTLVDLAYWFIVTAASAGLVMALVNVYF